MSLLNKVGSPYISTVETLDNDNCMWITTDEPLKFTKNGIDIDSKNSPPDIYDGKQIILSSDRIVFNAKKNEVIVMSNKGIHNTSNKNFSVDSGDAVLINSKNNVEITSKNRQIVLTSSNETILNAPHIYLGEKNANEPLVLGNKVVKLLDDLITAILTATYPTAGGPSGTAINSTDFNRIKSKITDILSKQNYTK
jgi:co-chaperonin GroES (HSP10)